MQSLTQFDLVASPTFDAFQNTPDLTPYDHVPAAIPLDQDRACRRAKLLPTTRCRKPGSRLRLR